MAAFKDLLKRVADATLRGQLEDEYKRVSFAALFFGIILASCEAHAACPPNGATANAVRGIMRFY